MSSRTLNVSFQIPLIGAAFYFAIGILYHYWDSDVFSWSDPILYVTMAFWPIFVLGWFLVAIAGCLMAAFVITWLMDLRKEQARKRRIANASTLPKP